MRVGRHTQELKEAIISKLKADENLAAVVGTRVYGEVQPDPVTWPFVRYGLPNDTAFRADGWSGKDHSVTLHSFAKGRGSREVNHLNGLISDALDEIELDISAVAGVVSLQLENVQVIHDNAESSGYHGIISFRAITFEVND